MAKRADTWMPIYIGDYLCDTGDFSPLEHGAYLLLIMSYWTDGRLPNDDRSLASIARISHRTWKKISVYVKRLFDTDTDGSLIPRRVEVWRNRTFGRLPQAEWRDCVAAVIERDGNACAYCGDPSEFMHCDHVHPLSRGGTNHLSNLVMACRPCNLSKADRLLSEWLP